MLLIVITVFHWMFPVNNKLSVLKAWRYIVLFSMYMLSGIDAAYWDNVCHWIFPVNNKLTALQAWRYIVPL